MQFLNFLNCLLNKYLWDVKTASEKELTETLKSMASDKSPGNDDLTKEFFETWSELKKKKNYVFWTLLVKKNSVYTTQRQVIIKLNVDLKVISKALSKRLKNVLPSLISGNQTRVCLWEIH